MGYLDDKIARDKLKQDQKQHDQRIALELLKMGEIDESQGAQVEIEIVERWGSENVITDSTTGLVRRRTEAEGFAIEKTPKYKMEVALNEISNTKESKNRQILSQMNTYNRLVSDRGQLKNRIMREWSNLKPENVTKNFYKIEETFSDPEVGELAAFSYGIGKLSEDIAALESLEALMLEQEMYYKGQEEAFAGLTGMIDPHEFYGEKGMLDQYMRENPNAPIAGLEKAYITGKATSLQRKQAKIAVQSESRQSASASYADLRNIIASGEFDITDYTEDEMLQKEFSEMIQHSEYGNFMKDLESNDPKVRELFYNIAGNQMSALEGHHKAVSDIESEFQGADEYEYNNKLFQDFTVELQNIKNKKDAFKLYDKYESKLTNKDDKQTFFLNIEEHLGSKDLYPSYRDYLRGGSGVDKDKPLKISRREGVLLPYTENNKVDVEKIYNALSKFEDPKLIAAETFNLSSEYTGFAGVTHQDISDIVDTGTPVKRRYDWDAGKAMFGGALGADSPYYNAFYDNVDATLKDLVKEEDPWGPDWLFYGLPEEHSAPKVIKERYGEELYLQAVNKADKAGKKAQLAHINKIIKKGSGEDYQDLLRTLDLIQGVK